MKRATARNTFPTSASAKDRLPAVCCQCGRTRSPHGVRPPLRALPRPLCRYESIILLAADTCLLTELSNVVAYPCRHSRAEDRQMATGQPSSGKSEYGELAHCLLGATNETPRDFVGVARRTIRN